VAEWFIGVERQRRHMLRASSTEVRGEITLSAPTGDFTLTAVADRIDRLADGGYSILDYKTGSPPTDKDIKNGFAPQLPLEAAIAAAGGFEGLDADDVAGLAFWRLSGGAPAGAIKDVKGNLEQIAEEAREGLLALVASFDNPDTPYNAVPDSDRAPRFNDYAHLARIAEWAGLHEED
ncbi:MAG: PD-(D/E)XK nuclease family protein, partial [Pseudomonadota bacterium]|nr:PD-(D/E)XK nuclease family protein [Pseudomonadota bacterium]